MTGHGCFGHYLYRIGKEGSEVCHECGEPDDTAQHTLADCSRWSAQRQDLVEVLGDGDLSLHNVVDRMLCSERNWVAVASFCETVILQKEAAERAREEDPNAPSHRRGRGGRRRARYRAHLLPQQDH
ncbi:uncharacterized protein LOC132902325 [Amyelois transitella]|uniref:uncharacterized protein LOC132902325 n=1 Tax=Amyelois transitella TaxID=680683 RepID=UPI0029906A80|nr:uncharacterized protein LOC132902325 [Amyelois transitella]